MTDPIVVQPGRRWWRRLGIGVPASGDVSSVTTLGARVRHMERTAVQWLDIRRQRARVSPV
jgi:hypothetical protein